MTIVYLPFSDDLRMAEVIRDGIPARALKTFAAKLNLNLSEMADAVLMPCRTIERRVAANARLRAAEAERVVRLARPYAKAPDVFENGEEAIRWIAEPLKALGGEDASSDEQHRTGRPRGRTGPWSHRARCVWLTIFWRDMQAEWAWTVFTGHGGGENPGR